MPLIKIILRNPILVFTFGLMRFLVIIPVFVLFLANMPFIHEMPMQAKSCMDAEEEETCMMKMSESSARSCLPGKEAAGPEDANEGCCNRGETTTTCICVFTFAAPAQDIKTFQVHAFNTISGRTGYLQLKWKDPHIASPGQPPDHV